MAAQASGAVAQKLSDRDAIEEVCRQSGLTTVTKEQFSGLIANLAAGRPAPDVATLLSDVDAHTPVPLSDLLDRVFGKRSDGLAKARGTPQWRIDRRLPSWVVTRDSGDDENGEVGGDHEVAKKKVVIIRKKKKDVRDNCARSSVKEANVEGKYVLVESIFDTLRSGHTRLVKGSWVLQRCDKLRRQQDLPTEAFWDVDELHEKLKRIEIIAVSYCWLDAVHPDPRGEHLGRLKENLRLRLGSTGNDRVHDVAMFLDYLSLPQKGVDEKGNEVPRPPDEEKLFKKGLEAVNIWYAHQDVTVWLHKWTSDEVEFGYDQRGWPVFENSISQMITDGPRLLDLSKFDPGATNWLTASANCLAGRAPPKLPEEFRKCLESLRFTNGADKVFVGNKYEETFHEVLGYAKDLWFVDLGWGDQEAEGMARVLKSCERLCWLSLRGNRIGGVGATALVEAAMGMAQLRQLDLQDNPIADEVVTNLNNLWKEREDGAILQLPYVAAQVLSEVEVTLQGIWARLELPFIRVASIEGGLIHWEDRFTFDTHLEVTSDGFWTTDNDGNTFCATLVDGKVVWDDNEVWVPQADDAHPAELDVPEVKAGEPRGTWELIGTASSIEVQDRDGALYYNQASLLHKEGHWLVADCDDGAVRLRVAPSGRSLFMQMRKVGAEDWGICYYGARPGGLAAGVELVTTAAAALFQSVEATEQLGLVPPGTRLVAAGPPEQGSDDSWMLPLLPSGCAVEARCVRMLESASAEDAEDMEDFLASGAGPDSPAGPAYRAGRHNSYFHLGSLVNGVAYCDTVLVRGTWLREQAESGAVLPRRQELPPEAKWDPTELGPLLYTRRVEVVAVASAWITPDHPDPEGEQLKIFGHALGLRLADATMPVEDLAVFYDWCSLHQKPRRPDQNAAFIRALKATNLWYTHGSTTVLMQTRLPPECIQFDDRGWPFYERATSSLIKDGSRVLDLGVHRSPWDWTSLTNQCVTGRRPGLTPSAFAEALKFRTFTNKADHGFINRKYRQTYEEALDNAVVLEFSNLAWGAEEAKALAAVLPDCSRLGALVLAKTSIGSEGLRHLAAEFPTCLELKELNVAFTSAGDGGAAALAAVLPRCPRLQRLFVQGNKITGEGAARLAEALSSCTRLEVLDLRDNAIGRQGAEAFLAAIPACRTTALHELCLERTDIAEDDRKRLRVVWQAAGKPAEALRF